MLDEETFRNEVWKKYESYSKENNKETFFRKDTYHLKNNCFSMIKSVASFIIMTLLGAGMVYAGTIVYNNIWKEPDIINYQEEKQVTQEDVKTSIITEEEAKDKTYVLLEKLGAERSDINNIEYLKYPDEEKAYWKITTENKNEIQINAKNGKLSSYYNGTIDDTKIKATANQQKAKEIAINLYSTITNDDNYELRDVKKVLITDDSCLWTADFCKKYDDIYNDYQCIRITFIPEINKMKMVNIFDEYFENNPVEISKEESINIVKEKIKDQNILNIDSELKIEKMNAYVLMQDKPLKNGEAYKMENIIRKVWSVNVFINKNNINEQNKYYVDCTTGEIIGGDSIK